MDDWEIRLLDEELELRKKVIKLSRNINHIHFQTLVERDQDTLVEQRDAMSLYLEILQRRIKDISTL